MKARLVSGVHRIPIGGQNWTLHDFYERRNHILVQRKAGGLGDILMHRMIFEDFKKLSPDLHLTFACPKVYHQAVQDHPFLDNVVDHQEVNTNLFIAKYDTTTICGQIEMINAPFSSPHRSDIWAEACGVKLSNHNMYIRLSEEEKTQAREQIDKMRKAGPVVLFAPNSAISSKNLNEQQCQDVIHGVRDLGCFVLGLHSWPMLNFDAPQIAGRSVRNFMALIDAADYIITVDSAAFHCAGGLGKPQVGIFSWADGKVYGKYYPNWELVQRHRDNGDWSCGPCYNWGLCTKCPDLDRTHKPCITELTGKEIVEAFQRLKVKFPI